MIRKISLKNIFYKGITKIYEETDKLKRKIIVFCTKEYSGNEQLIVALVMIAISVALVLIFKDKISTLLSNFMTNVTTKINSALGV